MNREGMNSQRLALDHPTPTGGDRSRARALSLAVTAPARNPVAQRSDALQILATQLREAIAERRGGPPGSDRYRRTDEQVAYLNELYVRLQRHMEVSAKIPPLDGGRAHRTRAGLQSPT